MMKWAAPYNRLFKLLDRQGEPTITVVLRLSAWRSKLTRTYPTTSNCWMSEHGKARAAHAKIYWDIFRAFSDEQKLHFFRLFITELEPHAKDEVDASEP
jgi:hypothetical protein